MNYRNLFRLLGGLVVEFQPVVLKGLHGFRTHGVDPKDFQNELSSAETKQPVNRMSQEVRGCLVLCSLLRQVKDPGHP